MREDFEDLPGVALGGESVVAAEVGERMKSDVARAELLAFPILLVLLLVVFRGRVAALLPLLVGVLSISGALAGLRLAAELMPLSVFALNIVLGLGLGLATDYSLLIVSRYREELATSSPAEAIRLTLATAGRTVLVSALTVAAAMSALMLFPLRFLFSLGFGGVLVALTSAAVALIVLPALLVLLGRRVDALSLRRPRPVPIEASVWSRLSRAVMRFPGLVAVGITTGLLLLAAPALD